MRFALLGCDKKTLLIADWIARTEGHSVESIFQPGEYAGSLTRLHPNAGLSEGWESLLLSKEIDAVVVSVVPSGSPGVDQRADQLRKLVQESVPGLMVHPVCESIVAFELEMIRSDTNCPLVPFLPTKDHAAFRSFCAAVRDSEATIGPVEQIVATRTSAQRDRDTVLRLLAEDSVLISELIGDVKAVSASGATGEDNSNLANLAVTFSGESAAGARWCVEPAEDHEGVQLVAVAERGKITLWLPCEVGSDRYRLSVNGQDVPIDDWEIDMAIAAAVERLDSQIAGGTPDENLSRSFHALEIVDGVTQSCRRRRTIELLAEQPTEEDTFKAMMAAGGCVMLMWTLVLVILGPLLFLTGSTVLRVLWYVLLIGPMSVFLGLQLLRFVFDDKQST